MKDSEIVDILREQSEKYKGLVGEHKNLETLLDDLNRKKYLTAEEELERKKIQKQKLLKKDGMATLIREYRNKQGG